MRTKLISIHIVWALLPLLFGCNPHQPENPLPEPDTTVLSVTLEVANENYTQTTVLDGIGDTQIDEITGQPEWVTSLVREEELYGGSPVLDVTVTSDSKLNRNRSADIVLKMTSGATVNLALSQRPGLPDFSGVFGGQSYSVNKAFEEDWSSQDTLVVINSVVYINDVLEVRSQTVPLPWNFTDPGVQQHLPDEELQRMMKNKEDWALVFNTTGIKTTAGANLNYFGLFNRITHTLRVFYYWPEDLIPPSGANDHLWHITFKGKQSEYNATQFAVPMKHTFEGNDAYVFQQYANTYYTTALTDEMGKDNKYIVVPSPGWWAFDMDMSAMRSQSFFDDYEKITIGMDLFDVQSIVMSSILEGTIKGDLTGDMNLDALIPSSANAAGKIIPSLTGPISSALSNTYLLSGYTEAINPWALLPVGVGCALSIFGNLSQEFFTNDISDPEAAREALGDLNAKVDLSMSGLISSTGTIKAQRSHNVPSLTLPIGYLSQIRNNKAFQMGKGIWNIENDPVVYVVKDAFWANKTQLTYYSRSQQSWYRQGNEVAEYDVSASPSQLGLRVISFFDPTSLGDVIINEDVFGDISNVSVAASYGVYPSGAPGNTDGFRDAAGLGYEPMSIATDKKDGKASTGEVAGAAKLPFKIFKDPYTRDFFQLKIAEEEKEAAADVMGVRLSSQGLNDNYERRYYGSSLFYKNPDASSSTVDVVQYVADPQIFVPFNEERRVITDPDLPDMVVTVQLRVESQASGEAEPGIKIYKLRYVPRIEYIDAADVPAIYEKIAAKTNGGMSAGVNYLTLEQHKGLVKAYSDEIARQLSK